MAPRIENDREISAFPCELTLREGDDIFHEKIPFKTVPWPVKTRHGGHTGVPCWIQYPEAPRCPKTKEVMELVCQLEETGSRNSVIPSKRTQIEDFGEFSFEEHIDSLFVDSVLYVFFDKTSRMACYIQQYS